jgi:hypothetical protein
VDLCLFFGDLGFFEGMCNDVFFMTADVEAHICQGFFPLESRK